MSKGAKKLVVIKMVRLTTEDARVLRGYADVWKCTESEALRRLIRRHSPHDEPRKKAA